MYISPLAYILILSMLTLWSKWMLKSFLSPVRELLSESEVCEADVSFAVQQDVLGLQVPVHDLFGVEVLDGAHDLGAVEEARGVAEAPAAAQEAEQLPARHEVHQHVQEALVVVGPEAGEEQ